RGGLGGARAAGSVQAVAAAALGHADVVEREVGVGDVQRVAALASAADGAARVRTLHHHVLEVDGGAADLHADRLTAERAAGERGRVPARRAVRAIPGGVVPAVDVDAAVAAPHLGAGVVPSADVDLGATERGRAGAGGV